MHFAKILHADAALLPLLQALKPQRQQGKQEAKLLLTALPIKHDRLRCGEGKRQTLKCCPGAEVTPLGCRRARTCWCDTCPLCSKSKHVHPARVKRKVQQYLLFACLCHLVLRALQPERPKGPCPAISCDRRGQVRIRSATRLAFSLR